MFIPLSISTVAFSSDVFNMSVGYLPQANATCESGLLYTLTYSPWFCTIITHLIYEFVVFPFLRNRLPNSLTRIGITFILIVIFRIGHLTGDIIFFFNNSAEILTPFIANNIVYGKIMYFLTTGIFEFVCAQSPYNMRGLLTGCTGFIFLLSVSLGALIMTVFGDVCKSEYCFVVHGSFSAALSLFGFILHSLVQDESER